MDCKHEHTRYADYVDADGCAHDVVWCHDCGDELSDVIA